MNTGDSNMALNVTGFRSAPPGALAMRYVSGSTESKSR